MAKKTLTQSNIATNNIKEQEDQVVGQSTALKTAFDQGDVDNKSYLNVTHIPELQSGAVGDSGANAIGYTEVPGADNVADAMNLIYAAGSGSIPPDNTITTDKIVDLAVTTAKIDNEAVTLGKLAQEIQAQLGFILPNVRDTAYLLALADIDARDIGFTNKYWILTSPSAIQSDNLTLDLTSQQLTAQALSGTKIIIVTDTTGFTSGKEITMSNVAGSTVERHVVDTVDSGIQLTLKTNLSSTYEADDFIYRSAPSDAIDSFSLGIKATRSASNTPRCIRYATGLSATNKVSFELKDFSFTNTSGSSNSIDIGISSTTDAVYISSIIVSIDPSSNFQIDIGNGAVTRNIASDFRVEMTNSQVELFENDISIETFNHSITISTATNIKIACGPATSVTGTMFIDGTLSNVVEDSGASSLNLSGVAGVNNSVSFVNVTVVGSTVFLEFDNRKTLTEDDILAVIEWLQHNKIATDISEAISIVADGVDESYEVADKSIYSDDGSSEELQFFVDKDTAGKNIAVRTTIQRALGTDNVVIERELGGLVK